MKNWGNKAMALTLVLMVTVFVFSGCNFVKMTPEAEKDLVVANYSGEDLKKAEFEQVFNVFKVQYEQQYGADVWEKDLDGKKFLDVAKEKVLDMLIDNKIQLKKAEELGIQTTDEEVEAQIAEARAYFDTEEKFNEYLKSQNMTLEYFTDSIRKDLTVQKLKAKLTENITITDEEVNTYYGTHLNEFRSVKASHILVDTEEEAKNVIAKLKAGEDFATLAKAVSKDPTAAENGGNLDYFKQGDMVAEFETAAFALKPGEISEPVKTQFGYHVIKVEDSKLDKFEDIKEQLKSSLLNTNKTNEYANILNEMRTKANVKKNLKNI